MARKKPPVPVLVVDTTHGITGLRKSKAGYRLPGGVAVVSAGARLPNLPEDLVPSEIHWTEGALNSPLQVDWRWELLDELIRRMP